MAPVDGGEVLERANDRDPSPAAAQVAGDQRGRPPCSAGRGPREVRPMAEAETVRAIRRATGQPTWPAAAQVASDSHGGSRARSREKPGFRRGIRRPSV